MDGDYIEPPRCTGAFHADQYVGGPITKEDLMDGSMNEWIVSMVRPTEHMLPGANELARSFKCQAMTIGTAFHSIPPYVDRFLWDQMKARFAPGRMILIFSEKAPIFVMIRRGKLVFPSMQFPLTADEMLQYDLQYFSLNFSDCSALDGKMFEETSKLLTLVAELSPTCLVTAFFMRCILDPNIVSELTLTKNEKGLFRVRHTIAFCRNDFSQGRKNKTDKQISCYKALMDSPGIFVYNDFNNSVSFFYWKPLFQSLRQKAMFFPLPKGEELYAEPAKIIVDALKTGERDKALESLLSIYIDGVFSVSDADTVADSGGLDADTVADPGGLDADAVAALMDSDEDVPPLID